MHRQLKEIPNNAKVIKDSRFMNKVPGKDYTPFNTSSRGQSSSQLTSFNNNLEQQIAFAFEEKDIVLLVQLLCQPQNDTIYIKKTRNSPLYVFINPNHNKIDKNIQEKAELIQTAIFLLLEDTELQNKDIAQSFRILTERSNNYRPLRSLIDAFHKRLGLYENVKKTEEIIQKLKNARQNINFAK